MSLSFVFEPRYECGPLGEVDFRIQADHIPEDALFKDSLEIHAVEIKINNSWVKFGDQDGSGFTLAEREDLRVEAAERAARCKARGYLEDRE